MNAIEKTLILKRIDEELKHLDALKSAAFLNACKSQTARAHAEWDRLTNKMNGVFLVRGLITGAESTITYQERSDKAGNQRSIDILDSDRAV